MSKVMHVAFAVMLIIPLGAREQDRTAQRTRIDISVLGFPLERIEDYEFVCSVSKFGHSVWKTAYYLDQSHFTRENLRTLFQWVAGQVGERTEIQAIAVSNLQQASWLFKTRGGSSHPKEDPTTKPEFVRMLRTDLGAAEYNRDKDSELLWYRLPGNSQASELVVIRGDGVFLSNPIPVWVVGTELRRASGKSGCVRRQVYAMSRPCDMTRTNLIDIFTRLSKAMPFPHEMQVDLVAGRDHMETNLLMDRKVLLAYLLYLRPESVFSCERPPVPFRTKAFYYRSGDDSFFYYPHDGDLSPAAQRVRVPLQ